MSFKLDDIYEQLSVDRFINAIQRKFFIEIPEPLCGRKFSAFTSVKARGLFSAFGSRFVREYEHLWANVYPPSFRPSFRPDEIEVDLFGFAHLQSNISLPSIVSPNLNPADSYASYTQLKNKEKQFNANLILVGEITTSYLDFEWTSSETMVSPNFQKQRPRPSVSYL